MKEKEVPGFVIALINELADYGVSPFDDYKEIIEYNDYENIRKAINIAMGDEKYETLDTYMKSITWDEEFDPSYDKNFTSTLHALTSFVKRQGLIKQVAPITAKARWQRVKKDTTYLFTCHYCEKRHNSSSPFESPYKCDKCDNINQLEEWK